MPSNRASAPATALGLTLGALALGGLVPAWLGGCSSDERPKLSAASAGTAGRANQPSAAGTSQEGGTPATETGGADGSPTEAHGGAPSSAGAAGAEDVGGPPGAAGDPGLTLEPCPSDGAGPPASFQGACSTEAGWTAGTKVAVASGAAPTFVAVTPSELTLVWREPRSSQPAYFLAERDAPDGAFGDPQELPFRQVYGVSPDGLRLTVTANDGSLAEATRLARGDMFDEPEPGSYAALVADAATQHLALDDFAISADDHTLYYSVRSLEAALPYPLRVSQRTGNEPWPVGVTLQACELKAYGDFGPHPTGISADGLTLFYMDGARGKTRAAFRASLGADFSWFDDLPGLAQAQPNSACDRLYFAPAMGNAGLLAAARK